MYGPDVKTVDEAVDFYDKGLATITKFQDRQKQGVIIGEFAVSNYRRWPKKHVEGFQEYENRIWPKFHAVAKAGALIHSYDCRFDAWSMKGLSDLGVTWDLNKVAQTTTTTTH